MSQDVSNKSVDPQHDISGDTIAISEHTIAGWTKDWFTWAFQAPPSSSPFETGSRGDGSGGLETGKVFFLGGYDTSGGPLDVYVRHGEPILVPLLNFADTLDPKSTENQFISDFKKTDATLFATLDGKSLDHLHAGLITTDFFSAGAAQPYSWAASKGVDVGTNLAPTKGVGYWIVLDGLSKGTHTLDFGGKTTADGGINVHTTDIIHIT